MQTISVPGTARPGSSTPAEIARGRTRALQLSMRCESAAERNRLAIYLGGGIWNMPRAATWDFFSDAVVIYPRGFVGEQTTFLISNRFIFDGATSFRIHSTRFEPPGEHFHWLELDENNPAVYCSYDPADKSMGKAALIRATPEPKATWDSEPRPLSERVRSRRDFRR